MESEVEGVVAVAVPQNFGLQMTRDPKAVLAEAKRAATALTDVIKAIPEDKKVMMGGEQYLEVDHWTLISAFYRCTPKIVGTEAIEYGDARGFLAKAVLVDQNGREVSAAEAMCLDDEERWDVRPKYEWQGGKRVQTGTVPVPANQLRSMAQTRAIAKVQRNVFSWVVVLAGYAPTPAEELTGHERAPEKPKVQEPKPAAPQDTQYAEILITKTGERTIKTKNGPSTIFEVHADKVYATFDKDAYAKAESIAGTSSKAKIGFTAREWSPGKFDYRLVSLELLPQEAEA